MFTVLETVDISLIPPPRDENTTEKTTFLLQFIVSLKGTYTGSILIYLLYLYRVNIIYFYSGVSLIYRG